MGKAHYSMFVIFLLMSSLYGQIADSTRQKSDLMVGDPAPTFYLKSLNNEKFFISDYVGEPRRFNESPRKVVILSFFASWCLPCRKEIPALEKLTAQYKKHQLAVFLINTGENFDTVVKFQNEEKYQSKILLDHYGIVAARYCKSDQDDRIHLPHTVIIGKDGRILYSKSGYREGDIAELEKILNDALPSQEG